MPLVRIALAQGRSPGERRAIADGVHDALVTTANVPADDRFQVHANLALEIRDRQGTALQGREQPAPPTLTGFAHRQSSKGE